MSENRSKFKPHWVLQVILGLLLCVYIFLNVQDSINGDPALANIVRKVVFLHLVGIYFIWFMLRSAVSLTIRFGISLLLCGLAAYFYTQYRLVGWSGMLNPEFELAGSRDHRNADPLKNFIYDKNASSNGPAFTQFLGGAKRLAEVSGPELHTDWNSHPPKELWRKKIGEGLSGFVIQGDYAITMEQRGPFELVVCYDTKTGQPRWAHREESRHESKLGGVGPRSTVLIDQDKVYAIGALGRLSCLNLKKGLVIWRKDILQLVGSDVEQDKTSVPWGRSGSALLVDHMLIVPGGGVKENCTSLFAFHKTTGDLLWKGGDEQISYASPQVMSILGVKQVISINEASVTGHFIGNGEKLWRVELPGSTRANANCSQIRLMGHDHIFVSKAYHEGARLIKLSRDQDKWSTELVWHEKRLMRTKFSSPIQYSEGKIVGLNERDLQGIDALKGEVLWEIKRYGYGQMLKYNQHILIISEEGELSMVDPIEGKEIAHQQILNGKTWCSLAIAGKYLLARNNTEAVCYELPLMSK